jgi:hypothetical protein
MVVSMADPQYALKIWLAKKLEPHGAITAAAEATGMSKDQLGRSKETESDDPKKRRRLQPHEIQALAQHFNELPPGYEDMTSWIAPTKPDLIYAPNPDDERAPEFDHEGDAAGFVDGKVVFVGKLPNSQPETSAQGGAGMGQIPDAGEARIQSNGIASGHHVVAEWVIPSPYLRSLGGAPDTTIIVPVYGHSMEPRLYEGDRVIIDVSQNTWVADAIYAIDDGDTNLQIKTIRKVTSSFPPVFRIVSENPPGDEVQRKHDEFRIVGRVVGRISRP